MPPKSALIYNTDDKHHRLYVLNQPLATHTTEQDLNPAALQALADLTANTETGMLPKGVVSYRKIGPHEQFAIVLEPTINKVFWGEYEGGDATIFHVAMPYQVITCEWLETNGKWGIVGCRFFFSPSPVLDLDAPLYHAPVANLNCMGYGDTSVGWVCLYKNANTEAKMVTPAQRCAYGLLRCSGNEAYNNANMSETMGPTFYANHRPKQPRLHNPQAWEKYTDKHGIDWTLNPKEWLPVLTKSATQAKHDGGAPLTLRRALYDPHVMYYHQVAERPLTSPKLATALMGTLMATLIKSGSVNGTSYVTATKTTKTKVAARSTPAKKAVAVKKAAKKLP